MSNLKIDYVPINKVKPYERNTKKHPKDQVQKIARQIEEHGWDVPIVVDAAGVIIKGHGRLMAAKQLKLKEVPVIVRADLSPEQVKASRIADNKVAESEWDDEFLKEEMKWLLDLNYDLTLTGFDDLNLPSDDFEFKPPNEYVDEKEEVIALKVIFTNHDEQEELFSELRDRGFKVKV